MIFSPTVQLGRTIHNNNMSRISVNDITSQSNSDLSGSLRCQSELTVNDVTHYTHGCFFDDGNSPVRCNYEDGISTYDRTIKGWRGIRGNAD